MSAVPLDAHRPLYPAFKEGPGLKVRRWERADAIRPKPPATQTTPVPTIFTALQEQVSLKFESRRGPVDLLVVEGEEKEPTKD